MSFLQPMLLAALPLAALPLIIHLINQRRYQTMPWAAMMFLLAANRMSRGYARIRQWLILALRTLAIAALVFAAARPLAGGLLGLAAGGKADTTLILLDRSPSMQQRLPSGMSKLEAARAQLAETLTSLRSSRWILIAGGAQELVEINSPANLTDSPHTAPLAAATDLPAMLQQAHDYIKANTPGRTEIWIASDLRENDWQADSGRWKSLRDSFLEFPQKVRFHLLSYESGAQRNLSVRVTSVRRESDDGAASAVISAVVRREASVEQSPAQAMQTIGLKLEIDGARSETAIELAGDRYELVDFPIALGSETTRGWGRVSLPADGNPADDQFYFVFDDPPPRQTVIVTDDPQHVDAVRLAAEISADGSQAASAEIWEPGQLDAVVWEEAALVAWQAPLPTGSTADLVQQFVDRGGQIVFFPPRTPTSDGVFGVRWQAWQETDSPLAVETWRTDQDLWAQAASGASLPVGKLQVGRFCTLAGDVTHLATLAGGAPLLARAMTDQGGAYFCTTTVKPGESSLAADGVALYVGIQRAIAAGAAVLGDARLVEPGERASTPDAESWRQLAGDERALSIEYPWLRGAYAQGDRLWAVNRPAAEDAANIISAEQIDRLFVGLDYSRASAGAAEANLVQEIWRACLVGMLVALLLEAVLCLPRVQPADPVSLRTGSVA